MKTRYKYLVGRFVNPATGRPINIHCAQRRDNGCDVYFYRLRQKMVLVGEEFRGWEKGGAS